MDADAVGQDAAVALNIPYSMPLMLSESNAID